MRIAEPNLLRNVTKTKSSRQISELKCCELKFSLQTETDLNAKIGHPSWDV